MNILFIHDGSDLNAPLIAHRELLAEHSMTLEPHVVANSEEAERSLSGLYDVVLINQTVCSAAIVDCGKPVIIFERLDGCQLGGSRQWMSRVAGVIKSYRIRPAEWNNIYNGRIHAHVIAKAGMKAENTRALPGMPLPQLSSRELQRIVLGYGFGAYSKVQPLQHQFVDFASDRDFAVHFAGCLEYAGTEIELHRKRCHAVVQAWAKANPRKAVVGNGRTLSPLEYWRTMFESRAVVSPWGWGESCHRDYEAILLGAILIKPTMDHVDCWPHIYEPDKTYIKCAVDFSDLPDIIERVNKEWTQWRSRREQVRTLVLHAMHPARIIRTMAAAISSLL